MKLSFINVGYGEAILLECPAHEYPDHTFHMLIDGGSGEDMEYSGSKWRVRALEYLRRKGISRIDLLLNTHIHEDHTSGLVPVVRELEISEFWSGLLLLPAWGKLPEELAQSASTLKFLHALNDTVDMTDLLNHKGVSMRQVKRQATEIEICSGLTLQILGPEKDKAEFMQQKLSLLYTISDFEQRQWLLNELDVNMNNTSVILRFIYRGKQVLLVGDTNKEGYTALMQQPGLLRADIFKVGHHGQQDSISQETLQAIHPSYFIICASSDRRYESIHPDILALVDTYGKKRGEQVATALSDVPDLPPYSVNMRPHSAVELEIGENGEIHCGMI